MDIWLVSYLFDEKFRSTVHANPFRNFWAATEIRDGGGVLETKSYRESTKSETSLAGTPLEDSSRIWERHCRRVCPGHPPLPGARFIVVDLWGDLLLRVWWCDAFLSD